MDLTAIIALLNGLGPWGIAIGVGLMLIVQKLNIKLPSLPAPAPNPNPTNPSVPPSTPIPLPLPPILSDRPLLNLLLSFLTAKTASSVSVADLPVLDLLHKEVGDLREQAKATTQTLPTK